MRTPVKRVELQCIRICNRCGRGSAELRSEDGAIIVITLEAARARELSREHTTGELRSLVDLVLDQLSTDGRDPGEVVLDVIDGRLHALLSFVHNGDSDVVSCTAEEGVALALRGDLKLYATDEALMHATDRPGRPHHHGRSGGSETLH